MNLENRRGEGFWGLAIAAALILLACAGPAASGGHPPAPPAMDTSPAAVLTRFVTAVERQAWPEAYALLSGRWRGQLTPAGLAADYGDSAAVGQAAVARVRALLAGGASPLVEGNRAVLRVGNGRSAVLAREEDAWRVDALE